MKGMEVVGLIKSKDKEAKNQYYNHYLNALNEVVQCAICEFTLEEQPKLAYANSKVYEVIGYTKDEFKTLYNNDLLSIIHEYDYERTVKFISDAILFDLEKQIDVRIRRKDGQVRWVSCSMKRTVNFEGEPVSLVSVIDITDKIMYQKRIDELSENVHCGLARVVILDKYIKILYSNHIFYQMFSSDDEFSNILLENEEFVSQLYSVINIESKDYPVNVEFELQVNTEMYKDYKVKATANYVGMEFNSPVYLFVLEHDDNTINNQKDNSLDELTQFFNRSYFENVVNNYILNSTYIENGIFCAIMLRNFAVVNDRYGYIFGDNIIREIATLLRSVFGKDVLIGRTGGMEFSILINNISKNKFSELCNDFCEKIRNIYIGDDESITLECKAGITLTEEEDFYSNMYNRAHTALNRLLHGKYKNYKLDYIYDDEIDLDIEDIVTDKKQLSDFESVKSSAKTEKETDSIDEDFKDEFISRMSHEIRTPMNAISGMADMLLAGELSGMNLEYANMIKSASNNLISIVDDILDISKMQTGKIEISQEEYELKPMLKDMTALINSRLNKKDIAFTVYVNPAMPKLLYGDEKHIRQIVMNILINAVKFTNKGFIRLSFDYNACKDDEIELCISVKDSGIGIHKDDLGKLFKQFSQVDSRVSRSADGIGLGLAISKQIAQMMGGKITVESELGVGSKFTFFVKQKVKNNKNMVTLRNTDKYSFLIYDKNKYYRMEIKELFDEIGAKALFIDNKKDFTKLAKTGNFTHVMFDYEKLFYDLKLTIEKNPGTIFIAMIGRNVVHPQVLECVNYTYTYKPFNIISLSKIIKGKKSKTEESLQKFIANDLKVLIVDDNPVNLKVAQGMISSYQCKITTALSGFEAIELLTEEPDYDLLFIDHMMPNMDGVETLNTIRNTLGEYGKTVPAVALTANVLPEARKLFKESGFQGFLAKPIVLKHLHNVMNELVPPKKKKMLETINDIKLVKKISEKDIERVAMKGVDVESGLRCCGNDVEEYLHILDVVLASGKVKVMELKKYAEEKNYELYGIEAHAFKSVAASIGAIKQSDLAREHEYAVKEHNYAVIDRDYQKLVNGYHRLLTQIQGVLDKEENKKHNNLGKIKVDYFIWNGKLKETVHAIANYQQKHAKELLKELSGYDLPVAVSDAVNLASDKMKLYEDENAQKILENVVDIQS